MKTKNPIHNIGQWLSSFFVTMVIVGTAFIAFTPLRPSTFMAANKKATTLMISSPVFEETRTGLRHFMDLKFEAASYYLLETLLEPGVAYFNFQPPGIPVSGIYVSGEQLIAVQQKLDTSWNHNTSNSYKLIAEGLFKDPLKKEVLHLDKQKERLFIKIKKVGRKTVIQSAAGDCILVIMDTMIINESVRAILLLNTTGKKNALVQPVYASKKQRLYATITDPNAINYFIKASPDSIKEIKREQQYQLCWEWIITPQEEGRCNLLLDIYFMENKRIVNHLILTEILPIYVMEKEIRFTKEDAKWLMTGIVVIAGWFLNFLYKRKKNQEEA